jgi:hypothetical protein
MYSVILSEEFTHYNPVFIEINGTKANPCEGRDGGMRRVADRKHRRGVGEG